MYELLSFYALQLLIFLQMLVLAYSKMADLGVYTIHSTSRIDIVINPISNCKDVILINNIVVFIVVVLIIILV